MEMEKLKNQMAYVEIIRQYVNHNTLYSICHTTNQAIGCLIFRNFLVFSLKPLEGCNRDEGDQSVKLMR